MGRRLAAMLRPTMPATIQLISAEETEKLDFDWGSLNWYASGALGNSSEVTVGSCRLKPGRSNPRHYHPNCSEILVVIEGEIRHTMADGTESEMRPGDTVTVLPNVWHRATNIGPSEALLFIVFTSADRQVVGE
jgi:quercetin dioxygenase-like cupin family protein